MNVAIAQLPLAALHALADGDAESAARLSPVPLSPWLTGPEARRTWGMRAEQVALAPRDEPWVTGVVLDDGVPVGKAGFHAAPDDRGTVEVGYAIDPAYRRRGLGGAALAIMLDRARESPAVNRVLASVGPWNTPSLRMLRSRGFQVIGQQEDEEDGLEIVHALDVAARPTGSADSVLVVLRGSLGGGQQVVARALRTALGDDLAVIDDDLLGREGLGTSDVGGGLAVDLVDAATRFALDRGRHVVIDGVLDAASCGSMLRCLLRDHVGLSRCYLLDAPSAETVRRHASRPRSLVPGLQETVLGADTSAEQTVARILDDTGLRARPTH